MDDPDQLVGPTIAQLRLIVGAILAGALLFGGIVAILVQTRGGFVDEGLDSLGLVGIGIVATTIPAAFVLRSSLWRRAGAETGAARAQHYAAGVIVFVALLESGILANLVFWMITGEAIPCAMTALFPFALALAFGLPSAEQRDGLGV